MSILSIVVTATCVILTYSLYTMSPDTIQVHHTESLIYTAPFVIYGIFRYIYFEQIVLWEWINTKKS